MLDNQQKEKVLQILRLGGTRNDAAAQAACSRIAIRNEARLSPEFSRDLIKAENDVKISLLTSIRTVAQKDWRAAVWLLERIWPGEYSGKETTADFSKQIDQVIQDVGEQLFAAVPEQYHSAIMQTLDQLAKE